MYKKPKSEEEIAKEREAREAMYKINLKWLKDLEAANLGDGELVRAGDAGCYSTHAGLGIPKSKVFVFSDPKFKDELMDCPHLEEAYPTWDWSGVKKQDLRGKILSNEEVVDLMMDLRATIAENKSLTSKRNHYAEKFK